jgi:hypothetical protein
MLDHPVVFVLVGAVLAAVIGGIVARVVARRQVNALSTRHDTLAEQVRTLTLGPEDTKEAARFAEERMRLSYQQAADWVKMSNSITWTMSSIYLVGSLLALNGALSTQLIGTPWRPRIGLAVVILCGLWLAFDLVYLFSSFDARKRLAQMENSWAEPRFYYHQYHGGWSKFGRIAVNGLLWVSILVPASLGLIVARPILPTYMAAHLVDIDPPKPAIDPSTK